MELEFESFVINISHKDLDSQINKAFIIKDRFSKDIKNSFSSQYENMLISDDIQNTLLLACGRQKPLNPKNADD